MARVSGTVRAAIERLARRRGLQHADARELVQEVLVAVAGAIERFDPDQSKESFRGWLPENDLPAKPKQRQPSCIRMS